MYEATMTGPWTVLCTLMRVLLMKLLCDLQGACNGEAYERQENMAQDDSLRNSGVRAFVGIGPE